MFQNYRRAADEVEELNMIPIMNLFIVLIPFLLAAAAFYQVGVIPTSTPQNTPNQTDVPKTPVTVTLNAVVRTDGLTVTAASTSLGPEEVAALGFEVPRKGDGYDTELLQTKLAEIKASYPKSNTILLMPQDDVQYAHLVALLDAMRERPVKGKVDVFEPLFPVTVFSQFVPPPPPDAEPGDEEPGDGEPVMDLDGSFPP